MFEFESKSKSGYPTKETEEKWAILSFVGTKTTQRASRRGETRAAIMTCQCKHGYCALHALVRLFQRAPSVRGDRKAFELSDGSMITYQKELAWIKARARQCGMNPARFATHGFRSGGCIDHLDTYGRNPATEAYVDCQANWKSKRSRIHYDEKRDPKLARRKVLSVAGFNVSSMRCLPDQRLKKTERARLNCKRRGFFTGPKTAQKADTRSKKSKRNLLTFVATTALFGQVANE